MYFREGKVPKELNWAGDGVQVFLQLLFHLWRLRGSSTIMLDEPDVYLHADLELKERTLAKTTPANTAPGRYRPPDKLLAFLEAL